MAKELEEQTCEVTEETVLEAEPVEEIQENIPEEPTEVSEEESQEEAMEESEEQSEEESVEETAEEDAPAEETPAEEPTEEEKPAEESEEETPEEPEQKELPYHERYYLKYREGKRNAPMELRGTLSFLQGIGFDGGELRQAREGKYGAVAFGNTDKTRNNQLFCSYCGREIAGVELSRLPDGRVRCTTCSSTLVRSKEDMEKLCKRVIRNMSTFFGADIDVSVAIQVMHEQKLKKKLGIPLGTRDSQSVLILGAAINQKGKFSIVLENGAPRISLIATFAHELTHIWQYTHWDNNPSFPKCSDAKRILIYEGMAKWAEIQYLYLIGETHVAMREEQITRARMDAYGIGFKMYEEYYPLERQAMTCGDTPFTPNRYPFT